MLTYLFIALAGFIALSILKWQRVLFFDLAEKSVRLLNNLLSSEDDDTKLELLEASTGKLVTALFKVILLLVISIGLAVLIVYIQSLSFPENEVNFSSWQAILALSVGASLPFFIPNRQKPKSDYSELAQLLHRLVLDNYTLGYKMFKREAKKTLKKGIDTKEEFVVVTGLARAGTTSMLEQLLQTGYFSALNYANMPFLLSPHFWRKIYNPKGSKRKERSHKDGIQVGLDSTEALEEYFFKVKADDAFMDEKYVNTYSLDEDTYTDYLQYQAIIRNDNQKIYLAKNNNFIVRYTSMRQYNERFVLLVLVRHPLYHAASLLEKHRSFIQQQEEDPFVLEYMNWLGHHEFGKKHKPFRLWNTVDFNATDTNSLDYWLEVWINYYSHAVGMKHRNTLFISYDKFCKDPNTEISSVLNKVGIEAKLPERNSHNNQRHVDLPYSNALLEQAITIYEEVLKLNS